MGGGTEGGGEGPLGAVETPPSPSHRPACHPHFAAEADSGRHGTRLHMRSQMRSLCVRSAGRNPGTGHLLLCRVIWGGEAGEQLGQEGHVGQGFGRKALIHSGCGSSSSLAVSCLLEDSGFPGMPSRKPLCC